MEIQKLEPVAIYLRKSREDLESTEETLARHERLLNDYCEKNNLLVKDVFREVVTGENLEERPQMRKLLNNIDKCQYSGIVVIEVERLSRGNPVDQNTILTTLKNSRTKIYTLNKVYDFSYDNEMDEESLEFGLFLSRREYRAIRRRLIRGKKQAQKEGYYIGSSLPFGFGKVKGDRGYILVPNEETPTLQLIFNKFVYDDLSLSELRDYLDKAGIEPQRAKQWSSTVLKKILRNKCYIGYINYNSRSTRTQECYKGKHQPIIDIETWNKAQSKLDINSARIQFGATQTNPLASLIKCSVCGSTMQKTNEYFTCTTPHCKQIRSYFEIVEKTLIEELQNELKNFNYFLDNYGDELEKQHKLKEKEIKLIKKEITKKDNMINKACEMLEIGVYTKEKYLDRITIVESQKEALMSKLNELEVINTSNDNTRIKNAIPILEKVLDEYWNLDAKNKNALLKTIIEKVEYTKTVRNTRWNNTLDDMELKIFLKI